MCGIAGQVTEAPPDEATLIRMAGRMAHRGPDEQRTWIDGRCGLAFRRLAIIDLDPRSGQPQHLGPLHLVFNGEIYNYRELRDQLRGRGRTFDTEGDAEVLLHAFDEWGGGALDRLNGMFALALWDDRAGRLTLASDAFGEKPLYYLETDGGVVFGSDIRAIAEAVPDALEAGADAVAVFLARDRMPPPDESFFRRVRRLPGAHRLTLDREGVRVERWWEPRQVAVPANYGEAVVELRRLLVDSIRLRLRADVPVGTSLSGGVDSSSVVALSSELAIDHSRHAFTARFPGFDRDEWPYATIAAKRAQVRRHHPVEPTAESLARDLDRLVREQEEPFSGLSIYAQWRVFEAARAAGIVVLLDGQGADELFGGYDRARGYAVRSLGLPAAARAVAGDAGLGRVVLHSLIDGRSPRQLRYRVRRRLANPYASAEVAATAAPFDAPDAQVSNGRDPLRRELANQAFVTSLPKLLRYADRDSMAHSCEVRLPFLDRRIADFAFSAPASYLLRGGVAKAVLRDAVRGSVPDALLDRTDKVGFEPPQTRWLETPALRARAGEVLLDSGARSRGLYDSTLVEQDLRAERWRDPGGLWRALNTELWLREFSAPAR